MPKAKLLPFTVISRKESSGQISCDHVEAESAMQAFAVAALDFPDYAVDDVMFIVALPGHLTEGAQLTFPGEGEVCGRTVLEQTDVFS